MKLLNHQKEVLKKCYGKEGFGNFDEQGLGKTITTLFEAKKLWQNGLIDAVIVVAPNGVHANWTRNEVPNVFAKHEVDGRIYYAERPFKVPPVDSAKLQIFCFNVGTGNFNRSSLLRLLNAKNYAAVPVELKKWNKVGGKVLPGLVKRRSAEAELWDRT